MSTNDQEWAIPEAPANPQPQNDLQNDPPIVLIHKYQGQPYSFPLTIAAAADHLLTEIGATTLMQRVAAPNRITLIITVGDGMMGPVLKVLDELALNARQNAGFASVATAAEYAERAQSLADSPYGMMIHVGSMLRRAAGPPAKNAAEALFDTAIENRTRQIDHTPAIR